MVPYQSTIGFARARATIFLYEEKYGKESLKGCGP